MSRWGWAPYVPVATRKARARREMEKLRKKGKTIHPVEIQGRLMARTFWGKGWCSHLESFSDYENRLPRGRTYARNGSVCHLGISAGKVEGIVSGTEFYKVAISIKKLDKKKWATIKSSCSGRIGSLLELLQGKLSDEVMTIVTSQKEGLFPLSGEMSLSCSCPDWAVMCKHVAAVLYGVGNRLDSEPELLFLLRGVDASELISEEVSLPGIESAPEDILREDSLGDIFGIDMDEEVLPPSSGKKVPQSKARGKGKKSVKTGAVKKSPVKADSKTAQKTEKKIKSVPKAFTPTGANIRDLRNRAGLSVSKFASRIGVSPGSVYRWEKIEGKCSLLDSYFKALQKLHNELSK
jgi:uncharacterized Zn finger protein